MNWSFLIGFTVELQTSTDSFSARIAIIVFDLCSGLVSGSTLEHFN